MLTLQSYLSATKSNEYRRPDLMIAFARSRKILRIRVALQWQVEEPDDVDDDLNKHLYDSSID